MRYRIFEGDLLGLLLVDSSPGLSTTAPPRGSRVTAVGCVATPAEAASGAGAGLVPECLQGLYAEVNEALTAWSEVEVVQLRHCIAYRRLVNVASVNFRPKHQAILVYCSLDPDTVALEEGFTRDMRGFGHLGTGDLKVRLVSAADLEKAASLIRRAFEAA